MLIVVPAVFGLGVRAVEFAEPDPPRSCGLVGEVTSELQAANNSSEPPRASSFLNIELVSRELDQPACGEPASVAASKVI